MLYERVKESAEYIRRRLPLQPTVAVILGSGLGALVDVMEEKIPVPYADIPHFPQSTVAGHAGNLVVGRIGTQVVAAMQGRFHYYEGFTMEDVAYPVYVMKLLGITGLIVTNACGGINRDLQPGDLMLIEDAALGADVVGMSTVPETIVANYLGMDVLGISCITNMATGIAEKKHSHTEVLRIANESSDKLCALVHKLLEDWAQ